MDLLKGLNFLQGSSEAWTDSNIFRKKNVFLRDYSKEIKLGMKKSKN